MTATVVQYKDAVITSGNIQVTLDAAPTEGNWLVALCCFNAGTGSHPAAASGWTKVPGSGSSSFVAPSVYYKQAGAGESALQQCAGGGLGADEIVMFEIADLVNGWSDLQLYQSADYGDDSNYDSADPSVTPSGHAALILFMVGIRDGGGSAAIPTDISDVDQKTTGANNGNRAVQGAYAQVNNGVAFNPTVTWNATTDQVGYNMVVLNSIVYEYENPTTAGLAFAGEAMDDGDLIRDGAEFKQHRGISYPAPRTEDATLRKVRTALDTLAK